MKIPKTDKDYPHIKFIFTDSGKLKLEASEPTNWGGINAMFSTNAHGGGEGNVCPPKELGKYLDRFITNKIKKLEKQKLEIDKNIVKLNSLKSLYQ